MEKSKKRLLFLYNRFPYPVKIGIDSRVMYLLESLSKRFEVDLVCNVQEKEQLKYIPVIQKYCKRVEAHLTPNRKSPFHRLFFKTFFLFSYLFKGTPSHLFYSSLPETRKRIKNLIKKINYDVFFFEYWFWDKSIIQSCKGFRIIDTNDVQFLRETNIKMHLTKNHLKHFVKYQLKRYQNLEIDHMKLFDLIITTTEQDKKTFMEYLGKEKKYIVTSTGVDIRYFSPREKKTQDDLIIFYGAMNGHINIDAVLYLYQKIMPLIWKQKKDIKLMVLGSNPPKEIIDLTSDSRIIVTGYVKDVRDYLAMGDLVALPLRRGYGHRGRIFEVMAMAKPLVVSPVTIQGMDIGIDEGIIIANSPETFAQAVLNILNNKSYAKELGRKGRKTIEERFSNRATYDQLTDFISENLEKNER